MGVCDLSIKEKMIKKFGDIISTDEAMQYYRNNREYINGLVLTTLESRGVVGNIYFDEPNYFDGNLIFQIYKNPSNLIGRIKELFYRLIGRRQTVTITLDRTPSILLP